MARRAWGQGSLYQRSDGRYVGRVELPREGGRRRQRTVSGTDKAEVRRRLRALSATSKSQKPTSLTVGEWLERWLRDIDVRPRTRAGYRSIVSGHLAALGPTPLALLSVFEVREFGRAQLAKGLRPRTVAHHLACLRTALAAATRDDLIPRNPAANVQAPRVERTERAVLTGPEVVALLSAVATDRLHALYVLAATTGMRQGEILGLEWDAIDLDRAELHVRQSLSLVARRFAIVPPKTERSRRTVPLEPMAVEALRAHQKRQFAERTSPDRLEQNLVFTTVHGSPISGARVYAEFQAHLRRAGLPKVTFHSLRAFVASKWANAGMPPRVLMALLGHSTITMTMDLYSHTTTEDIREAMRRVG